MIYICSDLHFNHNKDFIWEARGFNSVEEMNQALINNWNSVVKDEDTVYVCGDCMMGDLNSGIELLKQLKGHKKLAIGNHDTDARIKAYKEHNIFEDIQFAYRLKYKKKHYFLSHYPTIVDNVNGAVINLYGHIHSTDKINEVNPHGYHIGVDSFNCYPVSIEEIFEDMKRRKENT